MLTDLATVRQWFSQEWLVALLSTPKYRVEELALEVLAAGGHRWRPYLCAGVYGALGNNGVTLDCLAVAVECLHKASLIHDDIEDDDKPGALHRRVGVAQALNVGDLLIHQSYGLLEEDQRLVTIANAGQLQMCRGQGEELHTQENKFAHLKTVPAFEIAFRFGAFRVEVSRAAIHQFCLALGEAYQAKDDALDEGASRDVYLQKLVQAVGASARFAQPSLCSFLSHYLVAVFGEDTLCPSLPNSAFPSTVPTPQTLPTVP